MIDTTCHTDIMRKTRFSKNADKATKNEFIPGPSGNFWLIFSSSNFPTQDNSSSMPIKKVEVHFDFQWHKVVCTDNSFQGDVSDEIFEKAMSNMKTAIKDGYGFEPQSQYGKTNYEKLVNFTCFPFAPVLNCFPQLFSPFSANMYKSYVKNNDLVITNRPLYLNFCNKEFTREALQRNRDGMKRFVEICNLEYNPVYDKLVQKGHLHFAEHIWIEFCGFREKKNINAIRGTDVNLCFARDFINSARIGFCKDTDKIQLFSRIYDEKTLPNLFSCANVLIDLWGETKAARIIRTLINADDKDSEVFNRNAHESMKMMLSLKKGNSISDKDLNTIENEGFTARSCSLIERLYKASHPECCLAT